MSYLLDTNICSAHLKRPSGLIHFFNQHSGRLHISTIVLAELYAWAHRRRNPDSLLRDIADLSSDAYLLNFDQPCARQFGEIRGRLLNQGMSFNRVDLMIAATALVHDLTLVTHNTKDFQNVPGLRLEDWLQP